MGDAKRCLEQSAVSSRNRKDSRLLLRCPPPSKITPVPPSERPPLHRLHQRPEEDLSGPQPPLRWGLFSPSPWVCVGDKARRKGQGLVPGLSLQLRAPSMVVGYGLVGVWAGVLPTLGGCGDSQRGEQKDDAA